MGWGTRYATVRFQQYCAYAAPSDRCLCRGMERGLEGSQSLLGKLQSLKSEALAQQVCTIEQLAEHNLDVFDDVERIVPRPAEERIFRTYLSNDRDKVVRTALGAVLAADVATVPGGPSRGRHVKRLRELSERLAVSYEDVLFLAGRASALESLLAGR